MPTSYILQVILLPGYFVLKYAKKILRGCRSLKPSDSPGTINNSNTIILTTTIPRKEISEMRRNNLINNFSKWNIPILFNDYIKKDKPIHRISYEMIVNNLTMFMNTNFEYAILCDDDFSPIEPFLEELNKTIDLLPTDWRCLHLCPGYLWGRKFRDASKISQLNPEYSMENIPFHDSGRFYMNCDKDVYFNNNFWLGGPIAMVVNKKKVKSILNEFIVEYNKCNVNNDVILTRILTKHDYVCRQPQLGYENEEGGTTF